MAAVFKAVQYVTFISVVVRTLAYIINTLHLQVPLLRQLRCAKVPLDNAGMKKKRRMIKYKVLSRFISINFNIFVITSVFISWITYTAVPKLSSNRSKTLFEIRQGPPCCCGIMQLITERRHAEDKTRITVNFPS